MDYFVPAEYVHYDIKRFLFRVISPWFQGFQSTVYPLNDECHGSTVQIVPEVTINRGQQVHFQHCAGQQFRNAITDALK